MRHEEGDGSTGRQTPESRLPPGQRRVDRLLELSVERPPAIDSSEWRLRIFGEVDNPVELTWDEILRLPFVRLTADFHCVTGWSRLGVEWGGILGRTVTSLAGVRPAAKFVIMHAYSGYTSNIPLEVFLQDDTLLAYELDGRPLPPELGGPLRAVVSRLYAYKSVKWLTGIEFSQSDRPGFWEQRGYHNYADPWQEQRYQ